MTEPVELQINPAKPSEIEFSVNIQGMKSDEPVEVRFIIKDDDMCLMFHCTSIDDDMWSVKFPSLKKLLSSTDYQFALEVIIDGYFFTPAEGMIKFISNPVVNLDKKTKKKPSVKASFTVKQDEDTLEERVAQAGGDAMDMSAPTNALLTPEFPPDVEDPLGDDEEEDVVVSSESAIAAPEFNPEQVAKDIVKSKLGKSKIPESKGFLFKRSGEGKAVITGLEDKATKQELQDKAAKVREILSGK